MSKTKSFEVVVEGTYYSGTRNNKIPRRYAPESFIVFDLPKALHTIQRQLLAERLQRKYEDYTGWRECRIVSSREITDGKSPITVDQVPIMQMSLELLADFVQIENLDVLVHSFGSIAQARQAVSDAFDDKKLRERQKREDAAARAEEEKANARLREANTPQFSDRPVTAEDAMENLDEPLVETQPASAPTGLEDLE